MSKAGAITQRSTVPFQTLTTILLIILSGCSTHKTESSTTPLYLKYSAYGCSEFAIQPDPAVNPPKLLTHELPKKPTNGPLPAYACVQATINQDGKVVDKRLVKTNNEEFANLFLVSLDGWTYESPTKDGKLTTIRRLFASSAK